MLTDLYWLESENERLSKKVQILEAEIRRRKEYEAVMNHSTWDLLRLLGMPEKEIFEWYESRKRNSLCTESKTD